MFEPIEEYILRTRDERSSHLNLGSSCIEIGGAGSKEYRGLLAHFLKTTIPSGKMIHLCHACHNAKCSNVEHLYWGTAKENYADQMSTVGFKPFNVRTTDKHATLKKAHDTMRKNGNFFGAHGAQQVANKREKLSKLTELVEEFGGSGKYGFKKFAMERLGVSRTHLTRLLKQMPT